MSRWNWLCEVICEKYVVNDEKTVVLLENGKTVIPKTAYNYDFCVNGKPKFIIAIRGGKLEYVGNDEIAKNLNKLAYCKEFTKHRVWISGDIFKPTNIEDRTETKGYTLFDIGELIASFEGILSVYISEKMPLNWLWSRKAKLKSLGLSVEVIQRRYSKGELKVTFITKLEIREFTDKELAHLKTKPTIINIKDENTTDARIKTLVKALVKGIDLRELEIK